MLLLTENASTIVKSIAAQTPDLAGAATNRVGLRIAADTLDSAELNLAVVPAPEVSDQIIETDGALVYLESNAVALLDDKVLDAQVEENGTVSFAIAMQPV